MDDSADAIQELLASYMGKVITIELSSGEKVSGMLLEVGGGILRIKTDKGPKIRKASNIEAIDLPDDESAPEPAQLVANNYQENLRNYPYSSSIQPGQMQLAVEEPSSNISHIHTPFQPVVSSTLQSVDQTGNATEAFPTELLIHETQKITSIPTEGTMLPAVPAVQLLPPSVEYPSIPTAPAIPLTPIAPPEPVAQAKPVMESVPIVQPTPPYIEPEAIRKVIIIEVQLNTKIQNAHLDLLKPDFIRLADLQETKQKRLWESIYDRYNNAVKIRELEPRYGRIQNILKDLEELITLAPTSAVVRRYYAYLRYGFAKNVNEAVSLYQEVTYINSTVPDWYNLAVLSLMQNEREHRHLAYYALGRVFQDASLTQYQDAWYSYIGLFREIDDYAPLASIYQAAQERGISTEEGQQLLEACVYLLKYNSKEDLALNLVQKMQQGENFQVLLREMSTKHFTAKVVHVYQSLHLRWEQEHYAFWQRLQPTPAPKLKPSLPTPLPAVWATSNNGNRTIASSETSQQSLGTISEFDPKRRFDFLRRNNGQIHFFQHSSIIDEKLLDQLCHSSGGRLPAAIEVVFTAIPGSPKPAAVNISRHRDIKEIFELAVNYANEGDYERANVQIKRVLAQDPNYPEAHKLHASWREFARARGVPRGSTSYARAKRKQLIEKDLEGALQLLREAIQQHDSVESAIKDLAGLLMQVNRSEEAIEVLLEHRTKIKDQQSVDNMLVDFYQKVGQYPQAITLLRKMLTLVSTFPEAVNRKAQLYWRVGTCYLRMESYEEAETWFRKGLDLGVNNKSAQRNLALCLLRLGRDEEAETLLQGNLPDAHSADLLNAITRARETGQSIDVATFDTEDTLANFSSDISNFARFFIEHSDYEGVDSQYRIDKSFKLADVHKLEELATHLGTRRPNERARYYLSAAKILLENEDWEDGYNQIYKYLCRSFASRGDAAITENKPIDTIREWYCEALNAYDGDRERKYEQDANNAIVRFLLVTISRSQVPFQSGGPENLSIDEGLELVLRDYAQPEKMFPAIAYLAFRSQFAASQILNRLYTNPDFQTMALNYLCEQGIAVPDRPISKSQFSELWKQLQLKEHKNTREIVIELHTVAKHIDLTTASLEENLTRLRMVLEKKLFFDQDRRQIDELQKILETMLDLSQQATFEEKERLCTQIEKRCQDLLSETESNPTRLSVESTYPIVGIIKATNADFLNRIYESSAPQLTLRLPKDMESYSPDANNRRFEVQVVIENKAGSSPADMIELIIQEDSEIFTVGMSEIKLEGSLRGGDQRIKPIPIQVTELALELKGFTLPIYAQYHTRSGDTEQTREIAFAINLYSADQFKRIDNPYANYANGHIVRDKDMFYGRSELIRNIAEAIGNAREQSKNIVIFGQKRSGKSSVLYHLNLYLQHYYDNLLVVDLESVGGYLDEESKIPLLYQLLGAIMNQLRYAIEDQVEQKKRALLNPSIPDALQFYQHPTPLRHFQDVLKGFKRAAKRTEGWSDIHIVLLLDEFSYLYDLIARRRLPEDFMKNWKAILQEDLFSVVLVGQDFMPKFIKRFKNEFAAIKDQRISYLELKDARALIEDPIRIGVVSSEGRYREKAVDRIIDLTAASPFYIQIFCDRLVEYMNRKRINLVTQADVEQVKNELVMGVNALDEKNFDNLVGSGDTSPDAIPENEAIAVLKVIAKNSRTGPCSRDRIVVETQTDVEKILQDLLAREVIEAKGQYYAIRVGLFKEWLNLH